MTNSHNAASATVVDRRERKLVVVGHNGAAEPAPESEIRVLVAHGDRLARAGLAALLDAEPGLTVAGAAGEGAEAVALAAQVRPDVLLMDRSLPGMDVGTVTQRILAGGAGSPARVLVVGAKDDDDEVLSSLRAGASGFVVRDAQPTELTRAIRAVAAGEAALSPVAIEQLIAELAAQPDPMQVSPELLEELTARELEVMALVARGLSNEQIAEQLVVTRATAKTHVSRVMTKLRAHHRAQLVTLAYETGLVQPRHPVAVGAGASSASLALA